MIVSAAMNILVLCTGNSARSILGEVLINDLGQGRLKAFSAGSHPTGRVNPGAIAKLEREGHDTEGLHSKSWDQFTGPGAEAMDIVITVCDSAAAESCPVWTGSPVTVHWGIPDPAGRDDVEVAFDKAYVRLKSRIERMLAVPLESLDANAQREALAGIHKNIEDDG